MRPPRKGVSYSQAIAEAYASAPDDEVVLDTLEFRHPSFLDSDGSPVAVRVVNDSHVLSARLEASAPLNAGQEVEFQPVAFAFRRPSESDSGRPPEVEIRVDNVSKILIPYLDLAVQTSDLITVTWRPYLESDLTGPHMDPVLTLTVFKITADMNSVTATAGFQTLVNRRFPAAEYVAKKFPGLVAR